MLQVNCCRNTGFLHIVQIRDVPDIKLDLAEIAKMALHRIITEQQTKEVDDW